MTFGKADLLGYMQRTRLAVVSTLSADGAPQSAQVGIATTDAHQIIFDTVSTSRKHVNLLRDPRAALVIGGPGEQTLQLEGRAVQFPTRGAEGAELREVYYSAWPDGRQRLEWTTLVYWRIDPLWARYTDYDEGPLIAEFHWPEATPASAAEK